jgi:hypothetical protein
MIKNIIKFWYSQRRLMIQEKAKQQRFDDLLNAMLTHPKLSPHTAASITFRAMHQAAYDTERAYELYKDKIK